MTVLGEVIVEPWVLCPKIIDMQLDPTLFCRLPIGSMLP